MTDNVERQRAVTLSALDRATALAGVPTAEHDLDPKTKPIPYREVRAGDVIMESPGYPVSVVTRSNVSGRVFLRVRYIYQSDREAPWPLGPFARNAIARLAMARKTGRRGTR